MSWGGPPRPSTGLAGRSRRRAGRPPAATAAGRSATPPAAPAASSAPAGRCGRNPENLTTGQQAKLAWIAKAEPRLYRAWLLKEGLRLPFQLKGEEGKHALARWLKWAARCRIPGFTALGKKIRKHLPAINASLEYELGNGGSPAVPVIGRSH